MARLLSVRGPLGVAVFVAAALAAGAPAAHAANGDLAVLRLSSDHPAGVPLGGTITYTYDIGNLGPEAVGALLIDTLGYGEVLVSASASQGTCTQVAPVTCSLDEMPAGSSWTITVVTRANTSGTVTHAGIVRAPGGATNNNLANDLGTVITPVDATTERVGIVAATTPAPSSAQASIVLGGRVGPKGDGTY